MKKDSDIIFDATEKIIRIIREELRLYGLDDAAIDLITGQIIDVWDVGGQYAISLLQDLDKASMN